MGFTSGYFTVSKLPPGVKHTAEAVAYVKTAMPVAYTARAASQGPSENQARKQGRNMATAPHAHAQAGTTNSVYNRSCNLFM